MQQAYYESKLYPLQDRVLKLMEEMNHPFYLTGGTALSRAWLHHRYSDDLDFFTNNAPDFADQVRMMHDALSVVFGDRLQRLMDSSSFHRWVIQTSDVTLKLEWINDVPFRKGYPVVTDLFHRTDTIENISSNKLCALGRNEPKDIADILYIDQMFSPHWPSMIEDAQKKELSVNEIEVAAQIGMYPVELLRSVRWIDEPNYDIIPDQLKAIAEKVLRV